MAIMAENPIVTPTIASQSFNEIWIKRFEVVLTGCNGDPAYLNATFGVVGRDTNGFGTFNPDFNPLYHEDNIFTDNDPGFQQLVGQVVATLMSKAQASGRLSPVLNPVIDPYNP